MAVARPVELTLSTFLAATAEAGCDEPHRIFAGGANFVPPSGRGTLSGAATEELADLRLLDGNELNEEFARTLRVLDRAHTEYFAHVRTGEHHYGVLVAALGRTAAVSALSEQDRVWLKLACEDDLTTTLTAHLPEFPPARLRPFSVPRSAIAGDETAAVVDPGRPRSRDADTLERMLTPPFAGAGYLHVARRAGGGPRVQANQAVVYADTDIGRLGFDVTGNGDNQHVVAFPGDTASLSERLTRIRRTLR